MTAPAAANTATSAARFVRGLAPAVLVGGAFVLTTIANTLFHVAFSIWDISDDFGAGDRSPEEQIPVIIVIGVIGLLVALGIGRWQMRVLDVTVHTWDLARAIGADESLDPDLVVFALTLRDTFEAGRTRGSFAPPTGEVPAYFTAQAWLLHLSGRQPSASTPSDTATTWRR